MIVIIVKISSDWHQHQCYTIQLPAATYAHDPLTFGSSRAFGGEWLATARALHLSVIRTCTSLLVSGANKVIQVWDSSPHLNHNYPRRHEQDTDMASAS
jgi:hypothetical protein